MEQKPNKKPVALSVEELKEYTKPRLVEYGRIGELTKNGAAGSNSYEDELYTLTSP